MPAPKNEGEAIASRLLSDTGGVVALVSTRVWPSKPTQDPTGNHVLYYRTGGGDGSTLSGPNGLKNFLVRVEAVAETQGQAEAILSAVVARLAGWVDRPNGVQACFASGDADEQTLEDGRQVSGQTFSIWFKPQG